MGLFAIVVLVFLFVLLYRTVKFKPLIKTSEPLELETLDEKEILDHFVELIKQPTISDYNPDHVDQEVFENFKASLINMYPNIEKKCQRLYIEPMGILYKWQGSQSDAPLVLMSHFDVVPVDEKYWSYPPFSGEIVNGEVWGRGTIDTKSTLLGIMEAAEYLIKSGFEPNQDIYFAFGGDEEVSGGSAPAIVDYFKENNIKPSFVLDEGGAVVNDVFPGVKKFAALIGVTEKGYMDVLIKGKSSGGHASAPPVNSLNLKIASAVMKVETKLMKSHFTPTVLKMFDNLGRHSTFIYRLIFSNMWLFKGPLKLLFTAKGGQMNALIRTTMAVTKLEGSKAFNVLPAESSMGINCRILTTDSAKTCLDHIKAVVSEEEFEFNIVEVREASPTTNIESEGYKKIEELVNNLYPDAIVSPYLMTGGTDSRHFTDICDTVLRFAPYRLDSHALSLIHSNNERIAITSVMDVVQFYIQLMRQL